LRHLHGRGLRWGRRDYIASGAARHAPEWINRSNGRIFRQSENAAGRRARGAARSIEAVGDPSGQLARARRAETG
jgi:hypothetical protein